MIIAISSIVVITITAWALNKILPVKICPICAGVSLTWLWMLFGMGYGLLLVDKYQLITAVLMGGSVIGITNKLSEKYKAIKTQKSVTKNNKNEKGGELKNQLDECC